LFQNLGTAGHNPPHEELHRTIENTAIPTNNQPFYDNLQPHIRDFAHNLTLAADRLDTTHLAGGSIGAVAPPGHVGAAESAELNCLRETANAVQTFQANIEQVAALHPPQSVEVTEALTELSDIIISKGYGYPRRGSRYILSFRF